MLLLTSTSDLITMTTGSGSAVDVHATWVDRDASGATIAPGRLNTAIASATTTTVVPSPAAGVSRNVQTLLVRNKGGVVNPVSFTHTDGSTASNLIQLILQAGYSAWFMDGIGWALADSAGQKLEGGLPADGGVFVSAGSQSLTTGVMVLSNANGITFGMTSGTVTASHNGLTTARASNDAIGLNTALTANGVAVTANSSGLSLNFPAFLTTAAQSNHSHGNPTLALTNLLGSAASASDGFSLSLSAVAASQSVQPGIQTIAFANTTFTTGAISFSNANGFSFGSSGGQVTASYTLPAGATNSFWVPGAQWGNINSSVIAGNGSVLLYPAQLHQNLSASRAQHFVSVSISSSSNSSHAGNISLYLGVYTRTGSTLSLASSGSQSFQWSNTSNNSALSINGLRNLTVPIDINASPGDYWVALMSRTSSSGAAWFTASNQRHNVHNQQLAGSFGELGNNTRQQMAGFGFYSASSSALPGSIAFTQITGAGSALGASVWPPAIQFENFNQ